MSSSSAEGRSAEARGDTRTVLLVFALCVFASGYASRVADPLVLPLAEAFSIGTAAAAAVVTAYALPYALAQPFLGPIGDRIGKARLMRWCIGGCALMLMAGAVAPNFPLLVLSRALAGICAGGLMPLVLASLGDRYALHERQVMIGRMLFAVIGGQTLGAMVSGLVGTAFGWRAALGLAAAIGVLAAVQAWRGAEAASARPAPVPPPGGALAMYRQVFAHPKAGWVYGCVIAEGLLFFGLFPFAGLLLTQTTPASAAEAPRLAGFVLAGFGLGGLVYALAVRWLLQTLGARRMALVGSLVAAACLAALPWAGHWSGQMAAMTLAGLAFQMVHNSLQTQATELAPAARASAVALFAGGFFAGQGLGPLLIGPLLHAAGPAGALAVLALGVLALGAAARWRVLG